MNWQDRDDYKRHRVELEECHKIAADMDMSNPVTEVYEIVQLEMHYSTNYDLAKAVAQLVAKWKETHNAYYMDKAFLLCHANGQHPSPAVIDEMTAAAKKRYQQGTGALKATSYSVDREANKWRALLLMMNLIFHGEKQARAGSKAAQYMVDVMGVKPIKASSLDKYYLAEIRASGIEDEYFESWRRRQDVPNHEGWKQIIELLPEAGEDLKGNRRE